MAKRAPFFPLSDGVPRVEDRRVIRGIVDVRRDGFRWNDAPNTEGHHKNPVESSCALASPGRVSTQDQGVYSGTCQRQSSCNFGILASQGPKPARLMIAASHVKADRPGARVRQEGGALDRTASRWIAFQQQSTLSDCRNSAPRLETCLGA